MTYKLGYGRWDELKAEVRRCWQFRLDWFLKSRTPQELGRRVDALIRLIMKEEQEDEELSRRVGSKRKGAALKHNVRASEFGRCCSGHSNSSPGKAEKSVRPAQRYDEFHDHTFNSILLHRTL